MAPFLLNNELQTLFVCYLPFIITTLTNVTKIRSLHMLIFVLPDWYNAANNPEKMSMCRDLF